MGVHKVIEGLIFDEEFETLDTGRWNAITPSNAVTSIRGDGQLNIKKSGNGRSTNVMTEIPSGDNILMQVYADYYPTTDGEGAGIVIWKNAMEKVEFVETADTDRVETYTVWRAVKRGNLWVFYAQQEDGSWELFDSTVCIEPSLMGVTLRDNLAEDSKDLNVNKIIMCRGTHIQVVNLVGGNAVKLVNDNGEVVRESVVSDNHSGVAVELPSIPFKGTIEIYDTLDGNLISKTETEKDEYVEMYGGDVYAKGADLKIKWRDRWLDEFNPTHLASLKNGVLELDMTLYNTHEYDIAEDTTIRVAQYLDHFGWKWVDISLTGREDDYMDELYIGQLDPLSSRRFYVKIMIGDRTDKEYLAQMMSPTNFYLEVVNR